MMAFRNPDFPSRPKAAAHGPKFAIVYCEISLLHDAEIGRLKPLVDDVAGIYIEQRYSLLYPNPAAGCLYTSSM